VLSASRSGHISLCRRDAVRGVDHYSLVVSRGVSWSLYLLSLVNGWVAVRRGFIFSWCMGGMAGKIVLSASRSGQKSLSRCDAVWGHNILSLVESIYYRSSTDRVIRPGSVDPFTFPWSMGAWQGKIVLSAFARDTFLYCHATPSRGHDILLWLSLFLLSLVNGWIAVYIHRQIGRWRRFVWCSFRVATIRCSAR
jgi:hypothetical protein